MLKFLKWMFKPDEDIIAGEIAEVKAEMANLVEKPWIVEEVRWSNGVVRYHVRARKDDYTLSWLKFDKLADAKAACDIYNTPVLTVTSKRIIYP